MAYFFKGLSFYHVEHNSYPPPPARFVRLAALLLAFCLNGVLAQAQCDDYKFEWATKIDFGAINAIETTSDGSLIVVGNIDGDAAIGAFDLKCNGPSDLVVIKYLPDGTPAWAFNAGGTGNDSGWDVALGADDRIYITGQVSAGAVFGDSLVYPAGEDFDFFARLSQNGELELFKTVTPSSITYWPPSIATDSWGSIVVANYINRSYNVTENFRARSSGPYSFYLLKYDQNGELIWGDSGVCSNHYWVPRNKINIAITSFLDIVVYGSFREQIMFSNGQKLHSVYQFNSLFSTYHNAQFLVSYSPFGNINWLKSIPEVDREQANDDRSNRWISEDYGVLVGKDGKIYLTGIHQPDFDFHYGSNDFSNPYEGKDVANARGRFPEETFMAKRGYLITLNQYGDLLDSKFEEFIYTALFDIDDYDNLYWGGLYSKISSSLMGLSFDKGILDFFFSKISPGYDYLWAKSYSKCSEFDQNIDLFRYYSDSLEFHFFYYTWLTDLAVDGSGENLYACGLYPDSMHVSMSMRFDDIEMPVSNTQSRNRNVFLGKMACAETVDRPEAMNRGTRLAVYPNPNTGAFTVACEAETAGKATLRLSDLRGAEVWRAERELAPGLNELPVDVSLPAGVYVLQIENGGARAAAKIVVE